MQKTYLLEMQSNSGGGRKTSVFCQLQRFREWWFYYAPLSSICVPHQADAKKNTPLSNSCVSKKAHGPQCQWATKRLFPTHMCQKRLIPNSCGKQNARPAMTATRLQSVNVLNFRPRMKKHPQNSKQKERKQLPDPTNTNKFQTPLKKKGAAETTKSHKHTKTPNPPKKRRRSSKYQIPLPQDNPNTLKKESAAVATKVH